MDYQVSARKYRPTTFEEVMGQPHVVQTLTNAIGRRRVAHAYVFSGMRGVGKTTVARILAKSLNCEKGPTSQPCGTCPSCVEITRGNSVDVIEIDGASNTGVDDVRELRENVKFSPFHGSYRVYIIDEVHMLSNSAFNALLKTLEEPPSHSIFIFATTEVHKIPATILSRCQHFTFRRISRLEIIAQLRHVADQAGVTIEERSLSILARASDGSMRDALSLLDQAVSFGGETVEHEDLEALIGSVPDELVRQMVEAILTHQASQAMGLVGEVMDRGFDIRVYCREILERIRNLLVACVVPSMEQANQLLELGEDEGQQIIEQAKPLSEPYLQGLFTIMSQTEDRLRGSSHPRFLIETAVVRAALLNSTVAPTTPERQSEVAKPTQRRPKLGASSSPSTPKTTLSMEPPHQDESSLRPKQSRSEAKAMLPAQTPSEPKDTLRVDLLSPNGEPSQPSDSPDQLLPNQAALFDWEQVVDRMMKEHPNIGSFLVKGSLVTFSADHIVLGFPKKDAIARWRTDKPENRALLIKVCEEVAGRSVRVQIIEVKEGQVCPPSMSEMRAKKKHEDDEDLMRQVKAHPLVKEALELWGGEVTSVQRVPQTEEAK